MHDKLIRWSTVVRFTYSMCIVCAPFTYFVTVRWHVAILSSDTQIEVRACIELRTKFERGINGVSRSEPPPGDVDGDFV